LCFHGAQKNTAKKKPRACFAEKCSTENNSVLDGVFYRSHP